MPIAIAVSFVVLQSLLTFLHYAIYETVATAFGFSGGWVRVLFIVLSFTFISASFLAHWIRNRLVDWYYRIAAYWFGLAHFLFMGTVVSLAAGYFLYSTNHYLAPGLIAGISLGAMFLLHLYGTWSSGRVRTTSIEIALPGLPSGWRGKRVAFVSDVHLGSVRQGKFAAKVARRLAAHAPEAVFIGGDLYDGGAADPAKLIAPFAPFVAHVPQGVYFISGNHEYYVTKVKEAFDAITNAGIRIIDGQKIDLEGLTIVGVGHATAKTKEEFARVLRALAVDPRRPSILLKHEPRDLDVARDAGFSFGFFGHTHQGQIFPLGLLTRSIYKGFDYGMKHLESFGVYTSSGVGTWGPPLRLGTRSEIVIATLK